jgi:GNAT superfamily N-acetyltransferase
VEARSVALTTELALAATRGIVTDRGDYLVVETPAEPGWTDGNYLVLPRAPRTDELAEVERRFAAELGAERAISLRWDDPSDDAAATPVLRAAGYEVDTCELMTAGDVLAPVHAMTMRALAAAELPATADLAWVVTDRHDEPYRKFLKQRARWQQQLVIRDLARFYGAFDRGDLVATLGMFTVGDLGRYQDVQTRASHRRRGIAGALLAIAAREARARGTSRFAIIAQPASEASRVYARVGFRTAEPSTRAARRPGARPVG